MKQRVWVSVVAVGLLAAGTRAADPVTVKPAAPEAWAVRECPPAELPVGERLRPGARLDNFEAAPGAWQAHAGGQNARAALRADRRESRAGAVSLRVDYQFSGQKELEYVAVGRPLELPAGAAGIGLWQKRTAGELQPVVRIADRSGEMHQFGLEEPPGEGWKFVACLFKGGHSWGGDKNGKLDPPLRLESLVFDRPGAGYKGSGTVWVDDLQVVSPVELAKLLTVEVRDARFGNVYRPGESVPVRARAKEGKVGWRVEDFAGQVVERGEPAAGEAAVTVRLAQPGYYEVRFDAVRDGAVADSRVVRLAAVADGFDPPDGAFAGFCTHFGQSSYPRESMELLRRYGFRRFRDEISWPSVERTAGKYELPEYGARFLGWARELRMEPLLIFDYAHPRYDKGGYPNSSEAIAGYAAYSAALAKLTRDTVREYEVWNEWIGGCGMNGRPGDHGPEAYGRLLKEAYRAVKAARPEATVVGIGGEYGGHTAENVATMIRTAGPGSLDAWSIHPYRYPRPPEASDLVGEVKRIAERARATGTAGRAWVTEIGYPTHRGRAGVDERTQARLAVRTLALLQGCGLVDRAYWYDFKDDGLQREYNEHNFGVVLHQAYACAPKPAAVALAVFARQTAGGTVERHWHEGPMHAVAYRRPDGQQLLVAWSTEGTPVLNLNGRADAVTDLVGRRGPGGGTVLLGAGPVYVVGPGPMLMPQPAAPR